MCICMLRMRVMHESGFCMYECMCCTHGRYVSMYVLYACSVCMLCVLYVRMCAREFMDVMYVCNKSVCYMYVYILYVCMFYVNCVGKVYVYVCTLCMNVIYVCTLCMYVMYTRIFSYVGHVCVGCTQVRMIDYVVFCYVMRVRYVMYSSVARTLCMCVCYVG